MTLQKDGKSLHDKTTNSGEKESENGEWELEDGNLEWSTGEEETGIMRINSDGSLTMIAMIINGTRKDFSEKMQRAGTMKKTE